MSVEKLLIPRRNTEEIPEGTFAGVPCGISEGILGVFFTGTFYEKFLSSPNGILAIISKGIPNRVS